MGVEEQRLLMIRREQEREADALREVEAALTNGDASTAVSYAIEEGVRPELPALLYRMWESGTIGGDEFHDALAWIWVESPAPLLVLGERAWLRMFKSAGFVSLIVNTRWTPLGGSSVNDRGFDLITEKPTAPVKVWRGASFERRGRGMSWTLERECAVDFAERAAPLAESGVFSALVPPRAVLAVFGSSHEQEVVVNPNMLRGRVVLDEVVQAPRHKAPGPFDAWRL
jgi:hypothetical protein